MLHKIRSSLYWKLILIITSVISIIVTAIGTFSYYKSSQAIDSDVQRFSSQILKQANLNMERYLSDNEQFFRAMSGSADFMQWTKTALGDRFQLYNLMKSLEERTISPYIHYHPELLSVVLYQEGGNESVYRSSHAQDIVLAYHYSFSQMPWIKNIATLGSPYKHVELRLDYRDRSNQQLQLPVLTYVQKFRFSDKTTYLAMDISLMSLQAILNEIHLGDNGYSLIVDEAGRIITSPETSKVNTLVAERISQPMLGKDAGSFYLEETEQMVVFQSISRTNWKVVSFVPYDDLAVSIQNIRNWTIAMTLTALVVSAVLIFIISSSITRRLKELRRTMRMTKLGRFDIRTQVTGIDEIGELGEAYNHLLERIDTSIQELAEARVVQQRAILSALQSQINAHFLYNALESINSMANIAGHDGIMNTTVALSNMLRYTSNYRDTEVTLAEEIAHVHDYMHIITLMYQDDISFQVLIEPELLDAKCLKAVLQPFVENSIKHSYEVNGGKLAIQVRVKLVEERYISIELEDDGIGMTAERLQEIQHALKQLHTEQEFIMLTRIGLLNVHYRLITFYKDEHTGVKVDRAFNQRGTKITIIYPWEQKEGLMHDSCTDR
ncbi:sensor histidine kinase [Paenibacillus sp. JSM ZJ436]|uniref:Integral membrane sensor signal transduction histidine kinase n=1 Tax=Paenibacillus algicola TaxID=2565926 RepID=A0A4P8XMM8_9BACL|nr:sensor histidine kinase [Paenibacillus algicola]QCT04052.1 integral membrane sensor signal transduction histidine kinase [Paenibacillus algicola]